MSMILCVGIVGLLKDTKASLDRRISLAVLAICIAFIPIARGELKKWSSNEALYDHLESVSWVEQSYDLQRQVKFIRALY